MEHTGLTKRIAGGLKALECLLGRLLCCPRRPVREVRLHEGGQGVQLPGGAAVVPGLLQRALQEGHRQRRLALEEVEPRQGHQPQRLQRPQAQGLEEVQRLLRGVPGAVHGSPEGVRPREAVVGEGNALPAADLGEELLRLHGRLPHVLAPVLRRPTPLGVHIDQPDDGAPLHQHGALVPEDLLGLRGQPHGLLARGDLGKRKHHLGPARLAACLLEPFKLLLRQRLRLLLLPLEAIDQGDDARSVRRAIVLADLPEEGQRLLGAAQRAPSVLFAKARLCGRQER
mmetsp:Transcript_24071/g.74834  ORF Transcript_24071/g.74834 Transcript_24071/m.74834 type:complete len:285 (-) Transcript_24071:193-1047(-)